MSALIFVLILLIPNFLVFRRFPRSTIRYPLFSMNGFVLATGEVISNAG